MKAFVRSKKGIACIVAIALVVVAAAAVGGYQYWYYLQPKFQDYTIELGTESVGIADFMTQYAEPSKVSFVTDVSTVDINCVGDTELTLKHGNKEETVTLHVVDTVAPVVEFVDTVVKSIDYVPNPEDFIVSIDDYAETTASFAEEIESVDTYEDLYLTVVVTDASGNATQQECLVSYSWLAESYTLELGTELTKQDLLLNEAQGEELIDQAALDEINASGVGEYTVASTSGSKTVYCAVTVEDTTPPTLELKNVSIYFNETATLDSFVASVSDASGDVELRLMTDLKNGVVGTYTVTIEAEDANGNVTSADATFTVKKDDVAPVISGLTTITLSKHSSAPNYLSGISATDAVDGSCTVSYNANSVDYDTAGTYYVTYTASDSAGNTATSKRKVVIDHDSEDVSNLVASIASSLSNDPEAIRDYVRSSISYSTNWGGSDPVWYGFTNKSGNCYVHAMCLKAIFDYKRITSQLIWTTDKTHYWLIVYINGGWKHIDATPSSQHRKYSLMNDEQRLSTLSGRTWDTSAWPACE